MKKVLIVFTLISFQGLRAEYLCAHPFYVSIIQLDHNLQNESLEITFKIFTDDLEMSIVKESDVNLYLTSTKENKKADSLISNYLNRHFKIKLDGNLSKLDFIGFEAAFDITKIYIEANSAESDLKLIEIESDILVSEIPDQSNVFHYEKNENIKSLILNRNNTKGEILAE